MRNSLRQFQHAQAQAYSLIDNEVSALQEDAQGQLWIGTETGGLNRYDRERHTRIVFQHQDGIAHSLSHNEVTAIAEDERGRLWIATNGGGLNRFDAEEQSFSAFRHDESDPQSLSSDALQVLQPALQGQLWVGSEGGINLFDTNTGRTQRLFDSPAELARETITALWQSAAQSLWIGTDSAGLRRTDPGRHQLREHVLPHDDSNNGNNIYRLYQDSARRLWVGSHAGLTAAATRRNRTAEPDPSAPAANRQTQGRISGDNLA